MKCLNGELYYDEENDELYRRLKPHKVYTNVGRVWMYKYNYYNHAILQGVKDNDDKPVGNVAEGK